MPSSWDVYYVVFLSAAIALGIPTTLALVSRWIFVNRDQRRAQGPAAPHAKLALADRDRLGSRINARFFLSVNATLVLIALSLALIPCVGIIRNSDGDKAVSLRALLAIVTLAGLAGLGLLYSSRKGDLSWVASFQREKPSGEREKEG